MGEDDPSLLEGNREKLVRRKEERARAGRPIDDAPAAIGCRAVPDWG